MATGSFGNPITGGGGALLINQIKSPGFVHNVSGWEIAKDGSAEFNNLTIRGTFNGANFVINTDGAFFYTGTPALGNLQTSITNTTGTDSAGNVYLQGVTSYGQVSGTFVAWNEIGGGPAFYTAPGPGGPWTQGASIQFTPGIANLVLLGSQVLFGNSTNCGWLDGVQNFILPAAGGPFIQGESFHTISNASGVSGSFRVKMLPWNAVFIDIRCTFNYTGASQTFTFGSLPNANYYPTSTLQLPIGLGGTPSGITGASPRVNLPTSGSPTIVVPSGTGSAINLMLSTMYPTN